LNKIPYKTREVKAEPHAGDSSGDNSGDWSSGVEELDSEDGVNEISEGDDSSASSHSVLEDSDEEQSYERRPRVDARKGGAKHNSIPRLPIKLPGGQVQQTGVREALVESDEESDDATQHAELQELPRRNVTGARFGRAAVADIIRIKSRVERLQAAKEQIAGICQEILSEPEQSVGLSTLFDHCSLTVS
jgi:nucleolar complex protein 3